MYSSPQFLAQPDMVLTVNFDYRFLQVEGSRMRVSTVLGAIVLVLIVINAAISTCRFLKLEGSYMWVFTVSGAIVLVLIIMNEGISTRWFLKVEGSYMRVLLY